MAYEQPTEMFTFVTCSHTAHAVEYRYMNRREADILFERTVAGFNPTTDLFIAYYCGSVGGLVNAHYAS